MEERIGGDGLAVELVSRVQMRAVLSGFAVAIGVYAFCMGLSWAIGLSTFQPTSDHARGLAMGNIVWGAIALWISLLIGAYCAALVGRSPDGRSGVLHGLVVWGASAGLLGLLMMALFGGLSSELMRLGAPASVTGGAAAPRALAPEDVRALAHAAGIAIWIYWAGIAGGLVASIFGGLFGARAEGRAPRRIGVRVPPVTTPRVPQPA